MEKTLKDYILECDLYPYSKENFDLMKECAEIDLMARYLENVEFIESGYGSEIKDAGYFQESVSETEYQALTEQMQEKVANVKNKVTTLVKKILTMLKTALGAVVNALKKLKNKAAKLIADNKPLVLPVDDSIAENWKELIDRAWSKQLLTSFQVRSVFKIAPKQKRVVRFKIDKSATFKRLPPEIETAINAVVSYIRGTDVTLIPLNHAANFTDIVRLSTVALNQNGVSEDAIRDAINRAQKGITFNESTLNNALKELDDIYTKLGHAFLSSNDSMQSPAPGTQAHSIDMLMSSCSGTVVLLQAWTTFSNILISGIE